MVRDMIVVALLMMAGSEEPTTFEGRWDAMVQSSVKRMETKEIEEPTLMRRWPVPTRVTGKRHRGAGRCHRIYHGKHWRCTRRRG